MNADEHQSLAREFGVSGFPTIKIFGHDKSKPETYSGARTASDMIAATLKAAKAKVDAQLGGKPSGGSSKVFL